MLIHWTYPLTTGILYLTSIDGSDTWIFCLGILWAITGRLGFAGHLLNFWTSMSLEKLLNTGQVTSN